MEGESVYQMELPTDGIIVLGNEANGISQDLTAVIQHRLSIPQFGSQQDTESLNVANATAIILSEFRRRTIER
jgi:TrmH family RNA methyltransferase